MNAESNEVEIESLQVRVDLHVWSASDGGRRQPVFDGHRPPWDIGLGHEVWDGREVPVLADATIHLVGCSSVAPGQSATADLLPHHPEYWQDVQVGSRIGMMEGSRRVGDATVISVDKANSDGA